METGAYMFYIQYLYLVEEKQKKICWISSKKLADDESFLIK